MFDVLLQGRQWRASCGSRVVAGRPEALCPPIVLREFGVVTAHVSAGHSLEAVDESAEFHGRGKRYEQVYMVGFSVEFLQPAAE